MSTTSITVCDVCGVTCGKGRRYYEGRREMTVSLPGKHIRPMEDMGTFFDICDECLKKPLDLEKLLAEKEVRL